MRRLNNSVDTVSAAATAIAYAENRTQQSVIPRRKWRNCWSMYWCFRSQRHVDRAALVPEPSFLRASNMAIENSASPSSLALPFVAPPSSPISLFQSEPPSSIQSPNGILSFTPSSDTYSPTEPDFWFRIGPYTHETQLVTPPALSSLNTPFTPTPPLTPPAEVQLTTPSSPEVPFAQLLTSSFVPSYRTGDLFREYHTSPIEFQSYQLQPGSPIGQLVSPSSVISSSGTSSPLPDQELPTNTVRTFSELHPNKPPHLLSLDELATYKLDKPILKPLVLEKTSKDETSEGQRVSFELTREEAESMAEIKAKVVIESSLQSTTNSEERVACNEVTQHEHKQKDLSLPSLPVLVKEFDFNNVEGSSMEPTLSSDWWANQKVIAREKSETQESWSFPIIQST